MENIRVVLGNQTVLLQDLMHRSIDKVQGLEIVGETRDIEELPEMVEDQKAHWVIISLPFDENIPEVFDDLVDLTDDLSLMAISDRGDRVKIRRIEVQEESIQEFSLEDLSSVLRGETPVPEGISS